MSKILTSCVRVYSGPGAICIARGVPRGWTGGLYKALAPGPWWKGNDMALSDYLVHYEHQLARLDPATVVSELRAMAAGHDPVLCCWEKAPLDAHANWCHRLIVKDWLNDALGPIVAELGQINAPRLRGDTPEVRVQQQAQLRFKWGGKIK